MADLHLDGNGTPDGTRVTDLRTGLALDWESYDLFQKRGDQPFLIVELRDGTERSGRASVSFTGGAAVVEPEPPRFPGDPR